MTPNTPAGGAVACHRTVTGNGEAWMWVTGMPSLGALDNLKVHPTWRIEYAYTQPPATVPLDAVRKVIGLAQHFWDRFEAGIDEVPQLDRVIDELEALTRGEGNG